MYSAESCSVNGDTNCVRNEPSRHLVSLSGVEREFYSSTRRITVPAGHEKRICIKLMRTGKKNFTGGHFFIQSVLPVAQSL